MHAQLREVFLGQDLCNFTAPVCSEVIAYHCIISSNGSKGFIVFSGDDDGFDELICGVFSIGRFNGICCGDSCGALSINHGIVGKLDPFPSFVTVHGIIPSDDRSNFTGRTFQMLFKGSNKTKPTLRIGITSISECMNIY